jgi:GcrA cell cycle regulator
MTWNADTDLILKTLHAEGYSASKIAEKLPGKTRNAVIGRLHRLGLRRKFPMKNESALSLSRRIAEGKASPRKTLWGTTTSPSTVAKHVAEATKPFLEAPTDDTATRTLATLERGECRWPIGDPKSPTFGYCGCKALPNQTYCDIHHKRAYAPVAVVKRRPLQEDSVPADVMRQREGVS